MEKLTTPVIDDLLLFGILTTFVVHSIAKVFACLIKSI